MSVICEEFLKHSDLVKLISEDQRKAVKHLSSEQIFMCPQHKVIFTLLHCWEGKTHCWDTELYILTYSTSTGRPLPQCLAITTLATRLNLSLGTSLRNPLQSKTTRQESVNSFAECCSFPSCFLQVSLCSLVAAARTV